jgi:hypothetical protein
VTFLAVIDPRWKRDSGGGGRGAQNHYSLADIRGLTLDYTGALLGAEHLWPVPYNDADMLVFMWATTGAMTMPDDVDDEPLGESQGKLWTFGEETVMRPPDAYVLARLLGLRVCATFVWCKVDMVPGVDYPWDRGGRDDPSFRPPAQPGIGQWSRCEHEFLLLCRRGSVRVPAPEARPRSVIYAPRGEHSAKPEEAWAQVIEPIARASCPGVVGIEFNARVRRNGWHAYGALDGEGMPLRYEEHR